jgi:hypothetical protein
MNLFCVLLIVVLVALFDVSQALLQSNRVLSGRGSQNFLSTSGDAVGTDPKLYSSFGVYKGKGAFAIKPISPSYSAAGQNVKISREGTLLFEFAPSGAGPREYDWTKKASFSLGATECAEIARLKEGSSVEFLHDPNAGCKLFLCIVYGYDYDEVDYVFIGSIALPHFV